MFLISSENSLAYFGDRPVTEIRTADIEDFIADFEETAHRWLAQDSSRAGAGVNQPHDRLHGDRQPTRNAMRHSDSASSRRYTRR
ncbi:MAG: hypothetical protein ACREUZ_12425 [Burkholderiales bacterium]